jgi:DtxR family Mn-dependent transcriptional regulator
MTEAIENYLKTIYELELRHGRVGTGRLATALGVSPASASEMLQRLARRRPRLVDYAPRQGAQLTPAGARHAIDIIRRHRLLETYLHAALGFDLG